MVLRWFCLLIPGYGLSESLDDPISLFSWMIPVYDPWDELIPGYDTIWCLWRPDMLDFDDSGLPDTRFWWFRKLSDACFEMIFLLSEWFWDDFASWLPRFALTIRIFWIFPCFWMILCPIYWILSVFLCLGPFWYGFSEDFMMILGNFKMFLCPFCLLMTPNPLDLRPFCIPVYRRYRYKKMIRARHMYMERPDAYVHRTHTSPTIPIRAYTSWPPSLHTPCDPIWTGYED